ncbi:hypothetical protein ACNKHO_27295 [Shigella flexneri]
MRAPRDNVAALITRANAHPAPVVALDIPSALWPKPRDAGRSNRGCAHWDLYCPETGPAYR